MNQMRILLISVLASVALCGCGIYSRYSRPDLDLAAEMPQATEADTLVSIPLHDFFTDPYLQALLDSGLSRNTDLRVALLQVEQSQAQLTAAKLSYLPSLDFSAQGAISHFNGSTSKTYDIGLSASWDIDIFGKITNAKLEALAALEGSVAYTKVVTSQLVTTIAESYYTLLELDAQVEISEQTLDTWDETITMLEALVKAGQSNEVAVLEARASRNALAASILTLRQSLTETENTLCSLLKMPSQPIERGSLGDQSFTTALDTGVPLIALANRPDVHQAESNLVAAFYAQNSARSAFYPSVTLSGSIGWTNGSSGIVNPGKWLSEAMAALTAPLFDRGTLRANLVTARAAQEQALAEFEQALLDASYEVNNAIVECQTADARIELDKLQVEDLTAAAEKTALLVKYTTANYLEVLTAQQSLLSAQLTLAQDQAAKINGLIHLYIALTVPA